MKHFIKTELLSPWSPKVDIILITICLSMCLLNIIIHLVCAISYRKQIKNGGKLCESNQRKYDLAFKYLPRLFKDFFGLACGFFIHYILIIYW